jgi:hypothetical protein
LDGVLIELSVDPPCFWGALTGPIARTVGLPEISGPAILSWTDAKPESINAVAAKTEYFIGCSLEFKQIVHVDQAASSAAL